MLRTRSWIRIGAIAVVFAYLASGLYFVRPDERGVVRIFGRVPPAYRNVSPGLNYAPPWPVAKVNRVKTTEVRRVYVGIHPEEREAIARGDFTARATSPATDMFTGDVNILKATLVVQYQVIDPSAYLFGTEDSDQLVRNTVTAVLIETLAGLPVDEALTTAKARLQHETLTRSQEMLDGYGCGVHLVAATLAAIDPPWAVMEAFQDVVSAKKDGERVVDEAVAEANRILPRARGEAAKIVQEAEGYRETRIRRSSGEADRFRSLLAEYRRNPEIYRRRVLLEKLEKILPKVRTYVLDQKPGDPTTNVRIIEPGTK
jgi:membrane protease subunit HflK